MAQEICPFCGAPGSFREAVDGNCYVCGMALPSTGEPAAESSSPEATIAHDEAEQKPAAPGPKAAAAASTVAHDSDGPAINLIQPRNLSPEYARRVTAAWEGTNSPFNNPQETLNSNSSKTGDQEGLVIGTRSLSNVTDAKNTDYQLTEVIGEGNMGTVWSARQSSLDRQVAIKIPKRSTFGTIGREQFISEVVVTGQLDHPNIVPIYDLARDESGQLFYSMKRVEGRSWDQCIHETGRTRQENVEVLMKVCDAIRFAHDRGVIHRDIKPQNIMVGKYGEVSVMDWGIALRLDALNEATGITRLSPAGTPAYMAPEMATANPGEIGQHTDVYLLGAVLFEIITGEPPHPPPTDSDDRLVLRNACLLIAARNVIMPTVESGELIDIACKAMATDIYKRYQTVEEFQDAIRNYLAHAESIALAERGQSHLVNAIEHRNGVYEDFAKARFAFDEAVQLWPENTRARNGLEESTLAYADAALNRGDHALGLSLLSRENPAHAPLLKRLAAAKRKSDRNKFMAVASAAAAACFLILGIAGVSIFAVRESNQKRRAETLRVQAETEAANARRAQVAEERARVAAESAEKDAVAAKNDAILARDSETEAKNEALAATKRETEAKNEALAAKEAESTAKVRAQAASYRSEIGLAAEEVRRNAFNSARNILVKQAENTTQAARRNWEWGHLMSLADDPSIANFQINGMPRVEAVAISPDQKWVAAGSDDGDVHVWWHQNPQETPKLLPSRTKEHAGPVTSVVISQDNRVLVTVGTIVDAQNAARSEIRFWELPDAESGEGLKASGTPLQYPSRIHSIALSPDGQTILTSSADSTAQLWSRTAAEPLLRTFVGHLTGAVWKASFSPDGSRIATAGDDGSVRIWDVGSGRELRKFEGHRGPVYAVEFSPSGGYVVSGGRDRRLLAWPLASARVAQNRTDLIAARLASVESAETSEGIRLGEHAAAVRDLSFSSDGKVLFSASHDNAVGVWSMGDDPSAGRLSKMLRGHGGWVRSCAATADGRHVLSGAYDGRVYLWDWENYAFPRVLRPASELSLSDVRFTSVAASPDARWVAMSAENGAVNVWDMRNPTNPSAQLLTEGHDWQATTGAYFRGGSRLLTGGGDNMVVVWDARLGNQLLRIGGWNSLGGSGWRGIAVASHQGKWIATGSDDTQVMARTWDAQNGQPLASFIAAPTASNQGDQNERPEATALAFSPSDDTLFVGDQWGNCYLFSASDGSLQLSFHGHAGKITAAGFLPDGRLLTASSDGTVARWQLQAGQSNPQPEFQYAHRGRVVALDISGDGSQFATAADFNDDEAVLRLWNTESGEVIHRVTLAELIGPRNIDRTNGDKPPMVRSVALHQNLAEALVTIFDPLTSKYQVGTWEWNRAAFRPVSGGLRDTSMALYAPNQDGAILTVGGRGARLRQASQVVMNYRPQPGVQAVSFSPDGQWLAAAGNDGTLKMWQLDAGADRWTAGQRIAGVNRGACLSVQFHPTRSDLLLAAGQDGTAKLCERRGEEWQIVATLGAGAVAEGAINQAIFSPPDENGNVEVTTASDEGNVKIWSLDGNLQRELPHGASVQCVTVSPDRKWLVTGVGSEAWVWNREMPQNEPVQKLAGHSAGITALAFLPDGTRLLTASRDFNVKLWDAQAWTTVEKDSDQQSRELLTLDGHTDAVMSISFLLDEKHPSVLTAGADGQAILWPSVNWQ